METSREEIKIKKGALEDAREQAHRCIYCSDPRCVAACPSGVEIPRLFGVLTGGLSALLEIMHAKRTVLNSVAHDLRTPLCVIIGNVGLVEDGFCGPLTLELEKSLRPIKKSAEELLAMLNEFLSFSRLEVGKVTLHAETFGLRDLVSELGAGIAALARAKGLELQWGLDGDSQLHSDPHKIREIVFNLLTNAVKYTEKGKVTLWAGTDPVGDQVWFKVTDTGRGMSEEEIDHIFEAFYQAGAPAVSEKGGVGLGLAIVKSLLDLFRGRIEVRSAINEGSTFQVFLPRLLGPAE